MSASLVRFRAGETQDVNPHTGRKRNVEGIGGLVRSRQTRTNAPIDRRTMSRQQTSRLVDYDRRRAHCEDTAPGAYNGTTELRCGEKTIELTQVPKYSTQESPQYLEACSCDRC